MAIQGPVAIFLLLGLGALLLSQTKGGSRFRPGPTTATPTRTTSTRPTFQTDDVGDVTAMPRRIGGTIPPIPAPLPGTSIIDISVGSTRPTLTRPIGRPDPGFVLTRSATTGRVLGGRTPAAQRVQDIIVGAARRPLAERLAIERDLLFDK